MVEYRIGDKIVCKFRMFNDVTSGTIVTFKMFGVLIEDRLFIRDSEIICLDTSMDRLLYV